MFPSCMSANYGPYPRYQLTHWIDFERIAQVDAISWSCLEERQRAPVFSPTFLPSIRTKREIDRLRVRCSLRVNPSIFKIENGLIANAFPWTLLQPPDPAAFV
jgi:hypothetical protein